MTRAGLILLLLIAVPALRAAQAQPASGQGPAPSRFDTVLAADVYTAALAFMLPRMLEAVPVGQLVTWGLKGITALDPSLNVERKDRRLRLTQGRAELYTRPAPTSDDIADWATAAAEMAAAAYASSPALREAGTGGIIQSFFDEMFNQVDPYSRYTGPREAEGDRTRRAGSAGVGMTLARRGGQIVVQAAITDGPAALGGIVSGDVILSVDGQSTRGQALTTVNGWIAGPEDTDVQVTWRDRTGKTQSADLVRAMVPPETVRAERVGTLLVLRVSDFNNATANRFQHDVEAGIARERTAVGTVEAPLQGIVVDLRGNRGGVLRQAIYAADVLLPAGPVISTIGRDPESNRQYRSTGGDLAPFVPVVVLVDGRTASAAEVLAAALADRGRAVLVGSSTLGKGLVQTIAPMPDGGELRVTTSRIIAPTGWPIQTVGVLPQVCTSLGAAILARQMDDLGAGQAAMGQALARHRALRPPITPAQAMAIRNTCPAAEGKEADMVVARQLIENPALYATALMPPLRQAPAGTPSPTPQAPTTPSAAPAVSNTAPPMPVPAIAPGGLPGSNAPLAAPAR